MSLDDFMGALGIQENSSTNRRITELEAEVKAHRSALLKVNDLLKRCIARIERLEAERKGGSQDE